MTQSIVKLNSVATFDQIFKHLSALCGTAIKALSALASLDHNRFNVRILVEKSL